MNLWIIIEWQKVTMKDHIQVKKSYNFIIWWQFWVLELAPLHHQYVWARGQSTIVIVFWNIKGHTSFILLLTDIITCLKLVNAESSSSVRGMPIDPCMRCTKFLFSTRVLCALSIKSCTNQYKGLIPIFIYEESLCISLPCSGREMGEHSGKL